MVCPDLYAELLQGIRGFHKTPKDLRSSPKANQLDGFEFGREEGKDLERGITLPGKTVREADVEVNEVWKLEEEGQGHRRRPLNTVTEGKEDVWFFFLGFPLRCLGLVPHEVLDLVGDHEVGYTLVDSLEPSLGDGGEGKATREGKELENVTDQVREEKSIGLHLVEHL
jgi:hypothetical protein